MVKKDIKEFYLIILLVLAIPFFMQILSTALSNQKYQIATNDYDIYETLDNDNQIKAKYTSASPKYYLNGNSNTAFIDTVEKKILFNSYNMALIGKVQSVLSQEKEYDIDIETLTNAKQLGVELQCSIIIIISTCLAGAIILMAEHDNEVMNYILTSPARYSEYLFAKVICLSLEMVVAILIFLISSGYRKDLWIVVICTIIVSFVCSIFVSCFSMFFKNTQDMILATSPIMMLFIILDILSNNGIIKAKLPLQSTYSILLHQHEFPIGLMVGFILVGASGVFLYIKFLGKIERIKNSL